MRALVEQDLTEVALSGGIVYGLILAMQLQAQKEALQSKLEVEMQSAAVRKRMSAELKVQAERELRKDASLVRRLEAQLRDQKGRMEVETVFDVVNTGLTMCLNSSWTKKTRACASSTNL